MVSGTSCSRSAITTSRSGRIRPSNRPRASRHGWTNTLAWRRRFETPTAGHHSTPSFPGEEYRPEFFDGLETLIRAATARSSITCITKTRRRPVYAPRSKATWRVSPAAAISPGRQPERSDMRSSTGTGLSPTGGPTDGCAVWMRSSRCCSRPGAMPISHSRRFRTFRSPTSSTRSTGRQVIFRGAVPTSTGSARAWASRSRIGCCWSRGRSRSDCVHRTRFRASNTGR